MNFIKTCKTRQLTDNEINKFFDLRWHFDDMSMMLMLMATIWNLMIYESRIVNLL